MGEATTWAKAQDPMRPRDPKNPAAGLKRDPRAKSVLTALSCYANVLGEAWAAVNILTVEASLDSERTCQRGLADLKAAGLIEETGRFETFMGKRFPIYRLPLEKGPANTRERMILEREKVEAAGVSMRRSLG